jgi:phosphatidylglycerophosphatase C
MNLALFDFDGTITTRELFPDFIRRVVPPGRLALGKAVLGPLVIGYRMGLVSGTTVRARIADFAFRGRPVDEIAQAGERFVEEVVAHALRPEAMARIDWHRAQGDTVVVVSGAFDVYLSHWCTWHGLEWMCSALESREGVLTGRYLGAQCVGVEKARRVRERFELASYPVVYAYGDTKEDLELLALAHRRVYRWREQT